MVAVVPQFEGAQPSGKGVMRMSDFEMLSIVLMFLAIIVALMNTKK